ncbi:head maturation protease, ClpP-related [Brevibacillus porteri]|uniref:ATP-dependent Clp protease proteolytic subunit n=1 Tax=Brevibacillus porteri TaxID=2126350 RepID=A0ABX5FJF8_9BACL|nr:head maturation protease, ClpP-related [Brevibacillus porteri]MED1801790.1 Clp protease ClpP [Brevibacillus porteri]MED2134921.1 Clp protease ClpP [Brevibacillus porteri]MED2748428.1 Clp protease ClpP [Brevibacillus porteri]MED2818352.1 Clp protease ClpP [Brevibacillus porteri]MED2897689.1 Clp protease ClpP [Brevibacillus porteri]
MSVKIDIKGVIVSNDDLWIYEWFEMDATSPKSVIEQINTANGDTLEVVINSGGGSVFAGSEIYTALKDYQGEVITKIPSLAASAASLIAMAGDRVMISPTAQIMIHNVSSVARGDYRDFQHGADFLRNYNISIANAYMLKSGMSQEELLDLMNQETWFTAQQALEKKLVDEIMFEDSSQPKLVANAGVAKLLPQEVIEKMRNEMANGLKPQPSQPMNQKEQTPATERPNRSLSLYEKRLAHNKHRRF